MKNIKQAKSIVSAIILTAGFLSVPVEGYSQTVEEEPDSIDYDFSAYEDLLEEIQVVAIRPLVKSEPDKLTYDVKADSDSKTYTVLEMLRKVPLVSVDGEDNIMVNGSSSFQVYVNGHPSLMYSGNPARILKSMPASMVKSIEVVTNPGARYDAEGTGGVLNLIMDQHSDGKDDDGYTLGFGAHGGSRGFDGNMNVAGQRGRLSYSANGIYSHMTTGTINLSASQIMSDREVNSHTLAHPLINFTMGSISADYAINARTDIGFAASINGINMNNGHRSITHMLNGEGAQELSFSGNGEMTIDRLSSNGNVSLSHRFDDSYSSNLSLIYQLSKERNKNGNRNDFSTDAPADGLMNLSDREARNLENTLDHTIQADFSTHPFEGHVFDVGIKLSSRKARSTSALDMQTSSEAEETFYHNKTDILAGYAEYSFPSGSFMFKGGLRYEQTWQRVSYGMTSTYNIDRNYGILVPSASVGYRMPSAGSFALTYNMRISRPGISYLNPFEDHSSPTSVQFGNPDLEVEKRHNFGLAYNLFNSKWILNTRISDSYTGNGIEQYSYLADGIPVTTFGNVAKCNLLKLDVSAVWALADKTRLILNGSVGYATLHNARMNLHNKGLQWNAVVGFQQTLPWDVKGSAYFIGSSKTYTIDGWRSGFNMVSVNLSKSLLSDRLNVNAGLTTGLSRGGKMGLENHSCNTDLQTQSTIRMPMLAATVGISYTLGSFQKKEIDTRSVDSDYIEQRSEMETISSPGKIQ